MNELPPTALEAGGTLENARPWPRTRTRGPPSSTIEPRTPLRSTSSDSNSWPHFGARATVSLFATSRFEWDLCATYRSEPILPPIPPEYARRVVVVTVRRGPHRNLEGYAITGLFEMDEAALVECALTWCPVLKGLPTFGTPHRRAAPDPKRPSPGQTWRVGSGWKAPLRANESETS